MVFIQFSECKVTHYYNNIDINCEIFNIFSS